MQLETKGLLGKGSKSELTYDTLNRLGVVEQSVALLSDDRLKAKFEYNTKKVREGERGRGCVAGEGGCVLGS
jgi:hypothetical protein